MRAMIFLRFAILDNQHADRIIHMLDLRVSYILRLLLDPRLPWSCSNRACGRP
jgi:hypothetical protein